MALGFQRLRRRILGDEQGEGSQRRLPKNGLRRSRSVCTFRKPWQCNSFGSDTVQPRLEAHNISDNVRQSDFLSLEEKFLPVCAGLAHCKDFGVETGFYMFLFFLKGTCWKLHRATRSSFPSLGYVVQGAARRNWCSAFCSSAGPFVVAWPGAYDAGDSGHDCHYGYYTLQLQWVSQTLGMQTETILGAPRGLCWWSRVNSEPQLRVGPTFPLLGDVLTPDGPHTVFAASIANLAWHVSIIYCNQPLHFHFPNVAELTHCAAFHLSLVYWSFGSPFSRAWALGCLNKLLQLTGRESQIAVCHVAIFSATYACDACMFVAWDLSLMLHT